MVGLVKAAVGLAGAILTQAYVGVLLGCLLFSSVGGPFAGRYVGFVGVPDDSPQTLNYILVLAPYMFIFSVLPSPWLGVFDGDEEVGSTTINKAKPQTRRAVFNWRISRAYGVEAAGPASLSNPFCFNLFTLAECALCVVAIISVVSAVLSLDTSLPHFHIVLLAFAIVIVVLWGTLVPVLLYTPRLARLADTGQFEKS